MSKDFPDLKKRCHRKGDYFSNKLVLPAEIVEEKPALNTNIALSNQL